MRTWDSLIEGHLRVCESRGLSESVCHQRRREIERFANWLKRRKPRPHPEQVTSELLLEYLKTRTAFHSKASVVGVMSNLRNMGEFLVQEGVWNQNPLKWIQGPKIDFRSRIPKRINKEHLRTLWETAVSYTSEYHRHLWVAVLGVLYGTGLRRGELERLNLSDWDYKSLTLKIDSTKTNIQRTVPVHPRVAQCLEAYLPHRYNKLSKLRIEEKALFVNRDGQRITGHNVSVGIHKLAEKAAVPLVTIHQFRHTCVSDLLEEGVGMVEVQKLMGHAALYTTGRYSHFTEPDRHKAASLHPINSMLASLSAAFGGSNE